MSHFIVGLTGGIGSGKTTVGLQFEALGIDSVDADIVAREIMAPGDIALTEITKRFGKQILDAQGQLDRRKLREIVFADPNEKVWLNQLTHPLIRARMFEALQQAQSPYVLLIAPLLLENGLEQHCNRVLIVDVPESVQIERTSQRDKVAATQVEQILASQINRSERLKRADDIIHNTGSIEQLQAQVDTLHHSYLLSASEKSLTK
ncbi:dephospho-CoA kinase [Algicola sagamiensis]|uniref:dephospho-CoA kinase n=1 Tax=Algicola sagamiensis TaxID=163869 RepID=UPI00036C9BD2|nr:dephospho-CoA kinase [Algicola sagamiensis]